MWATLRTAARRTLRPMSSQPDVDHSSEMGPILANGTGKLRHESECFHQERAPLSELFALENGVWEISGASVTQPLAQKAAERGTGWCRLRLAEVMSAILSLYSQSEKSSEKFENCRNDVYNDGCSNSQQDNNVVLFRWPIDEAVARRWKALWPLIGMFWFCSMLTSTNSHITIHRFLRYCINIVLLVTTFIYIGYNGSLDIAIFSYFNRNRNANLPILT